VRLDTFPDRPAPTPGDGQLVTTAAVAFPAARLSAGDNYFHLVSVDAQSNVGKAQAIFHLRINAKAPAIESPSHPDQSAWSANTMPMVAWTFPQGDENVRGAYWLLDRNGLTVPSRAAKFLPVAQKQLLLPALRPGIWVLHIVSVDKKGYITKAAAHYRLNIGNNPGRGSLIGTVVDGASTPMAGATVSINNGLYTQTTNAAGQYNFGDVTAAVWRVKTSSKDRSVSKTATVIANNVTTANFTLR
jgi:hypothetical protein